MDIKDKSVVGINRCLFLKKPVIFPFGITRQEKKFWTCAGIFKMLSPRSFKMYNFDCKFSSFYSKRKKFKGTQNEKMSF